MRKFGRLTIRVFVVLVMVLSMSSVAQADTVTVSITLLPGPFEVNFERQTRQIDGREQEVIALIVNDSRGPEGEGWQIQVDCTCPIVPISAYPVEHIAGQPVDYAHGPRYDPATNVFSAEPKYGVGVYAVLFEVHDDGLWRATLIEESAAP